MKNNEGKGYERLIKQVFIEIYGYYDDDNPDHIEETCEMIAYFSSEELPNLYAPNKGDWIKEKAQEWVSHLEANK